MFNQLSFTEHLEESKEIGIVERVYPSVVYAKGLPQVHPFECVVFETGDVGEVLSLTEDVVEILLFSNSYVPVGAKVTRTGKIFQIPVGEELLGNTIDALGRSTKQIATKEFRMVDIKPAGMSNRQNVIKPLETGTAIVDILTPLGQGQRQLLIGDRKIGKSSFLLRILEYQAHLGAICIYALIGKRKADIKKVTDFIAEKKLGGQTIVVAVGVSDPSGMIFLAPFTAMTIAEYFRDQGKSVVLILDDLTTHAHSYREISLLAQHFPGRSSYPGDIFYIHSRLLERAGNFVKGTISAFPVVESVLGDFSGYIQTNVMSITDGHVFFDTTIFNLGRRPAINPYLSVSRVGAQTQTALFQDTTLSVSRFLAHYERLRELVHFGEEFEERVRKDLELGQRLFLFFDQSYVPIIPVNIAVIIIGCLWGGFWEEQQDGRLTQTFQAIIAAYTDNKEFHAACDQLLTRSHTFAEFVVILVQEATFIREIQ